ncbi:MAG: 3-deoxy-manno-octulosonate cytidylyltransferase [Nitrospinales bacterium]
MTSKPKVVAVIPARWGSKRFPGKPLAIIQGRPMIEWVYDGVKKAQSVTDIIVATDDERVYSTVNGFGCRAVMTRSDHASGSDRIAEVVAGMSCDIVVNIQGDEPLISPEDIDLVVDSILSDSSIQVTTLKIKINSIDEFLDPNTVKVVTNKDNFALYFSRSPIPFNRDCDTNSVEIINKFPKYKHIGLYAYTKSFLLEFSEWDKSDLEESEKLEQLRILENGISIKVEETINDSIGVDSPDDVKKVEGILAN